MYQSSNFSYGNPTYYEQYYNNENNNISNNYYSNIYNYSNYIYSQATHFNPVNDQFSFNTSSSLSNSVLTSTTEQTFIAPPIKVLKTIKKKDFKCQICSGNADGFHYGAYTCNACTLFFKRASKKQYIIKCEFKNCEIKPKPRLACTYCRFQKCLNIGMSRNRSTYGRHKLTHNREQIAKKCENTILIENLDQAKSNIKYQLQQSNLCLFSLRDIIKNFYETTLKSISKQDHLIEISTNTNLILSSTVLFCVLFDIKLQYFHSKAIQQLEYDLFKMINLLETNDFKLTNMLRISVFLLVSKNLFSKSHEINTKRVQEIINFIKIDTKTEDDSFQLILWSNQVFNLLNFKQYV